MNTAITLQRVLSRTAESRLTSPALLCMSTSVHRVGSRMTKSIRTYAPEKVIKDETPNAPMPTIKQDPKMDHKNLANTAAPSKESLYEPDRHDYFTEATWPHPIYTHEQMVAIEVAHLEAKTWSDKAALAAIHFLRSSFDWFTGYRHPPVGKERDPNFQMTGERWLTRIIFLESIAGVPGMVGGMVRHLHSLRALRRDKAWIETLLEEACNERMHLLTFLKLSKPGWFMRLMLIGGQGVFFNAFFLSYLVSPRTCHRFVGYLEEEAIVTYSRCLEDIQTGRLPEWEHLEVPDIARQYWKMGDDCTMEDLILYVRADEAKHREVNHTFGNLDQSADRNPFALKVDNGTPQPGKGLETIKSTGWQRNEIAS
ncbi:alternative oxidase-domain-containing protein [Lipomyces arxii]|uniref:alternative oxidase-domain-containing protein n=1 Tax=Lipomyces arxii TaxID=56418 RepID=UPI0034CEE373